jgi:hypothetical protein
MITNKLFTLALMVSSSVIRFCQLITVDSIQKVPATQKKGEDMRSERVTQHLLKSKTITSYVLN